MAQPVLSSGRSQRVTAPAGVVTVGVPLLFNEYFGLPNDTIDAAATDRAVELDLEGVWLLDKSTAVAFAEGDPVYWDETNDVCAASGRFIGHCYNFGGVAAAAVEMRVRIDPRAHQPGAASGVARMTLDATGGLVQGTYYGDSIPDNARVTRSWYEVITTFTSAGDLATIGFGIETDDVAGILAAVAIGTGTPFDAGLKDGIQDGAIANFSEKTTAEGRRLEMVVGVEDLTAGVLVLVAEWSVTA
jgi:predicted RecA/RadA family phage recombinase